MKKTTRKWLVWLILGILPLSISFAHPDHAPLTFKKHTLPDGRIIYSNLPLRCFKTGVMTCGDYHPVLGNTDLTKPGEHSNSDKSSISIEQQSH